MRYRSVFVEQVTRTAQGSVGGANTLPLTVIARVLFIQMGTAGQPENKVVASAESAREIAVFYPKAAVFSVSQQEGCAAELIQPQQQEGSVASRHRLTGDL